MIFFKFLIILILSISLHSKEMYFDTISLSKIKKVIKKEEQIAKAYKEYIMDNASKPTSISSLEDYLPKGFSFINLFGKSLSLHASKSYIVNEIPTNVKSSLYDKYYSNEDRVYSKAPLSKESQNVDIVFSEKEEYILSLISTSEVTTDKVTAQSTVTNTYYLDDEGILHWYEGDEVYYSFNKSLIVYPNANMLDITNNISSDFIDMLNDNDVLYPGQQLFNIEDGIAQEYINIGGITGIVEVVDTNKNIGETTIIFSNRGGGMIVNGDIYYWGNMGLSGSTGSDFARALMWPVYTTAVRMKAKTYNDDIDDRDYYSSPLRPKFVDFFNSSWNSLCGLTIEGAMYCGGGKHADYFGSSYIHVVDSSGNYPRETPSQLMYKSRYFDGINNKASKLFANYNIWLILSQEGDIYRWGVDYQGFAGTMNRYWNFNNMDRDKDPEIIDVIENEIRVKFTDITILRTNGYRQVGALSQDGDIYIWGTDTELSRFCSFKIDGENINVCRPQKIDTDVVFKSISGGLEAFLGISTDDLYYKIYQPASEMPIILSINEEIKNYEEYVAEDDAEILSVDFSTKLGEAWNTGIVWVNGKNELKGDYFTADNANDDFFKEAISRIKWKMIKVADDDNGMCGVDIYNQMYCWGKMSFTEEGHTISNAVNNTFMLPIFNANLHDLDKDFLVAEGGAEYGGVDGYITKMTSGEWNPSENDYFIKYPTYIGGFNYEFIFK